MTQNGRAKIPTKKSIGLENEISRGINVGNIMVFIKNFSIVLRLFSVQAFVIYRVKMDYHTCLNKLRACRDEDDAEDCWFGIPEYFLDEEMCKVVVSKSGWLLGNVPYYLAKPERACVGLHAHGSHGRRRADSHRRAQRYTPGMHRSNGPKTKPKTKKPKKKTNKSISLSIENIFLIFKNNVCIIKCLTSNLLLLI